MHVHQQQLTETMSSPTGSRVRSEVLTHALDSGRSNSSSDEEKESDDEPFSDVPDGHIVNNLQSLRRERYRVTDAVPYDTVPKSDEDVDLGSLFDPHIFSSLRDAWIRTGWAQYDKVLGSGGFGTVFLAFRYMQRHRPHEERDLCALKHIPCYRTKTPSFHFRGMGAEEEVIEKNFKVIWTEVRILKSLSHPNIVRMPGAYLFRPQDEMESAAYLVLEYCDAGSLEEEVLSFPNNAMPEPIARFYFRQIVAGLVYMHDKGIAHCDLHDNNILMRYKFDGVSKKCVITDFGLAEICWTRKQQTQRDSPHGQTPDASAFSESSSVSGHVALMPPELQEKVFRYPSDPNPFAISGLIFLKADIWHLGHILKMMMGSSGESANLNAATLAFVNKLMQVDVVKRPSAQDVWSDEWMSMEILDPGFDEDSINNSEIL